MKDENIWGTRLETLYESQNSSTGLGTSEVGMSRALVLLFGLFVFKPLWRAAVPKKHSEEKKKNNNKKDLQAKYIFL